MGNRDTMVGPTCLVVRVVRPSGKVIDEANVRVEWEHADPVEFEDEAPDGVQPEVDPFPYNQEVKTDATGQCLVGVPSSVWSKGKLFVSKRHHGPVAARGTGFKSKPAEVPIEVGLGLFIVPGQEQTEEVRWGAPRVVNARFKGKVLTGVEVMLVEGGALGAPHPEITTRRLSVQPGPVPTGGTKPGLSEVDQELIYHIAHGDVAPIPETDYEFEHDDSLQECEPGKCGIVARPATPMSSDPRFDDFDRQFDYIPKVSVRNGVVGGLRVCGLASPGDLSPTAQAPQKFRFANGYVVHQNPRNVVGLVRLARELVSKHQVRVLLSVGFIRSYALKDLQISSEPISEVPVDYNKLKRDAHGRGRAMDVAGLMLDAPSTLKSRDSFYPREGESKTRVFSDPTAFLEKGLETKEYVPERDFLVFPHWGKVPMLIEDLSGKKRRVGPDDSTGFKGKSWGSHQFPDAFAPNKPGTGRIFYRLESLDSDPESPDQPVALLPAHVMTPRHYELAREYFQAVVHFFYAEYSHRNNVLGNLEFLTQKRGLLEVQKNKAREDDAAGGEALGTVGGFVLHPDVPSAGTRRDHENHIHANLGPNGPSKTDGGQWTRKSVEDQRTGGYER